MLALKWQPDLGVADVEQTGDDGALLTDEGLETIVLVALFTDRRITAAEAEELGVTDRRGYWADAVDGEITGSRLWTLERARVTQETIRRAELYAVEALEPIVAAGLARKAEARAFKINTGAIGLEVALYRPRGELTEQFRRVWEIVNAGG